MNTSSKVLRYLFAVGFMLISFVAHANSGFSANTLQGVKTVAIAVEGIHPDLARWGFTREQVEELVRSRIASSGLEIVSLQGALDNPGAALLEVKVNINRHTSDYANYMPYHVALRLKQRLVLPNSSGAFVPAVVWSEGQSGVEQPARLNRLNGYVEKLVDEFLSDLQTQNHS